MTKILNIVYDRDGRGLVLVSFTVHQYRIGHTVPNIHLKIWLMWRITILWNACWYKCEWLFRFSHLLWHGNAVLVLSAMETSSIDRDYCTPVTTLRTTHGINLKEAEMLTSKHHTEQIIPGLECSSRQVCIIKKQCSYKVYACMYFSVQMWPLTPGQFSLPNGFLDFEIIMFREFLLYVLNAVTPPDYFCCLNQCTINEVI